MGSAGRRLVDGLLLLAAANVVLILTGAYSLSLLGIQIGRRLFVPVEIMLALLMLRIWIRRPATRLRDLLHQMTPGRLFLLVLFIYLANGKTIGAVDTFPVSYLPFSLLREANFDLDEFPFLYAQGVPGYLIYTGKHYVSFFPPFAAVVALPMYLVSAWSDVVMNARLVGDLEKLAASVIAALSVAVLFLTLRRLTDENSALLVSTIYAFGTSTFSISAQALWQHGPSELFLALTLYCLVRGRAEPRVSAYAGFTLAAAVVCRYTDVFIALPLTLYVVLRRRRHLPAFMLAALPPALLLAAYHHHYFGSLLGAPYVQHGVVQTNWMPLLEGFLARMISPNRGLLVFSPIVLFSLAGMYLMSRGKDAALFRWGVAAVVLDLLWYSTWPAWQEWWSFPPRYLTDLSPLLALFLVPAWRMARPRPALKGLFLVCAALSIFIHSLGVFVPNRWKPDLGSDRSRMWDWADGQLVHSTGQLLYKISGRFRPVDYPAVGVSVDRIQCRPGERVEFTVQLRPGSFRERVDVYLIVARPDGPPHFLTPTSPETAPRALLTSELIVERRAMAVAYPCPAPPAPAYYTAGVYLVRAGAPADFGPLAPGKVHVGGGVGFHVLPGNP